MAERIRFSISNVPKISTNLFSFNVHTMYIKIVFALFFMSFFVTHLFYLFFQDVFCLSYVHLIYDNVFFFLLSSITGLNSSFADSHHVILVMRSFLLRFVCISFFFSPFLFFTDSELYPRSYKPMPKLPLQLMCSWTH